MKNETPDATPAAGASDSANTGLRHDADYRRVFEATMGVPFTTANRVERLLNGCRIFPAMIDAVEHARESIDFLTFVYWQGDVAERFGQALVERASAGVRVRVLLDAFGAHWMSRDIVEKLASAGAEVAWFRPTVRWRFWQADNRTHRKLLIVDGRIGFTGGVGIAGAWEGDARNPSEFRDTHFRLSGPVIDGLRGAFLSNWVEAGCTGFQDRYFFPAPEPAGEAWVQVLRTSAAVNYSDIATLFRLVVHLAESRLRITTGYFVPDHRVMARLEEAVARGVDVEVLMPGPHSDSRIAVAAGDATYDRLLAAGVKLYRYQPTMLHAKILLLDDRVAVVGSANFNHRSMGKDDEIALTVIDPETIRQLDSDFDADRARCRPITAADWAQRGLWQRGRELVGRALRKQA